MHDQSAALGTGWLHSASWLELFLQID